MRFCTRHKSFLELEVVVSMMVPIPPDLRRGLVGAPTRLGSRSLLLSSLANVLHSWLSSM